MKRYLLIFLAIFGVDVLTKRLVLVACPRAVSLNHGISWSLLNSSNQFVRWLVIFLVAAFVVSFIFYTVRQARRGGSLWGEVLVLSGAIPNLIDRFVYGGVIDFIQLSVCGYAWPVFNVADMAIVAGATLMLWKGIRS
ncbi:MAG: signal peptidase II [Candidatus Dependentiae bacterium]|nr:signal peptidase II [Candidatus Dependentiae bacterium]